MAQRISRRGAMIAGAAAVVTASRPCPAAVPFRFGLTPVFLDNDAIVIGTLRAALAEGLGRPIELVQRKTYAEVTGLLLQGRVDAAWLCGYPFLQHAGALALLGVPFWRGRPLYRSYLITAPDDDARGLADLAGGTHAFSDPDSNSGWLVTVSDIVRMGRQPDRFFARSIFTYGHRNVVRAVASGLTRSGSVDGYVWEALALREPALAERTRIVARSEWLGFPPIVAQAERAEAGDLATLRHALHAMPRSEAGRRALAALYLDAIAPGPPGLYDGIAARMRDVGTPR